MAEENAALEKQYAEAQKSLEGKKHHVYRIDVMVISLSQMRKVELWRFRNRLKNRNGNIRVYHCVLAAFGCVKVMVISRFR